MKKKTDVQIAKAAAKKMNTKKQAAAKRMKAAQKHGSPSQQARTQKSFDNWEKKHTDAVEALRQKRADNPRNIKKILTYTSVAVSVVIGGIITAILVTGSDAIDIATEAATDNL